MSIYILSDKKVEGALNLPVIEHRYIDIHIDIKKYDAVIFTSKNGVKALDKAVKEWQKLTIYTIGEGSQEQALALGAKNAINLKAPNGNEFANRLIPLLQGKRVLFPRAKQIVSDIENILKEGGIDIKSAIIYETICKRAPIIPKEGSVIIFSSPSTIECFLRSIPWSNSYKAVCIGEVTASYLPKNIKAAISNKNSLEACVKLAQELL